MSQEPPESKAALVRRAVAGVNNRDYSDLLELYHPDVVMHHLEGWPEPGPSVGREAVIREFKQLQEAPEEQSVEITDIVECGDRAVVRYHWRGSGTGPDLDMRFTFVFTFRDGKIVFQQNFWDHEKALETLGQRG